ncbi:MAG: heparan-alpha-glucosaminide N-acetyltransferase domain-containing protein, partial [Clostridia bacterium]|nr:heparan-alpha-glucosaminide N-acetyltransferase domain-containing protein [Clostridia bacterium]
MKLFGKEEINTSRQFEFDMAKAVCILGMVFVHCFETLSCGDAEGGVTYYIFVIVLDAIFGAGTFMICMGLGITYSWKDNADKLLRRGAIIFVLGYVLNIVRDALPCLILIPFGESTIEESIIGA